MQSVAPLIGIVALLVFATVIGVLLQRRKGRVRELSDASALHPAVFGAERFGTAGTIVQFSTEFCSRCPGVKRLLTQLAASRPGVEFVHVDLTHNTELAKSFNVLQTPTILFIDADGRPSKRLSGQVAHDTVRGALDEFAPSPTTTPIGATA